jgi:hypothetical protein
MARKNPPAKWVLPSVIRPPDSIDFCVPVPNDVFHLAAFRGALEGLASAYKWQDDNAHTAKLVAKVWREIADNLEKCKICLPASGGVDGGSEFMIRQNPDNPCKLESSLDGITWCEWADLSKCVPSLTPIGDQPQPKPGGCQVYPYNSPANQQWLIPVQVSSGDTIELMNAEGASNDPLATSPSGIGLEWFCTNGALYFGGGCVGLPQNAAGDQLSSQPHMSLILNVNGIFYGIATPFTVPSGVSLARAYIQLNGGAAFYAYNGSVKFDVKVCSGAIPTWTHTLDFRVSDYGFVSDTRDGFNSRWIAGTGWANGIGEVQTEIKFISPSPFTVTRVVYDISVSGNGGPGGAQWYMPVPTAASALESPVPDNATTIGIDGGIVSRTGTLLQYVIQNGSGGVSPTQHLIKAHIFGSGFDPWPTAPI